MSLRIAVALPFLALILSAQQFPALETQDLRDQKVTLPTAVAGHATVLVIGFTHASQHQTKPWIDRIGKQFPCYAVAVMEDVPRLVRGMAAHGIKSGTPVERYDRFLLLYHGEKELKQAAEFSTPDDAYVVVLSASGSVRWRFHGALTDAAFEQLKTQLAE